MSNVFVMFSFKEMLGINVTSSSLDLVLFNTSSSLTVNYAKESFSSVLTKNTVAMLVWLALSVINVSMVHTFFRHRYSTHRSPGTTYSNVMLFTGLSGLVYLTPVSSTRTRGTSCLSAW